MKLTNVQKWGLLVAIVLVVVGFLAVLGTAVQKDAMAPPDIVVETQAVGNRPLAPCMAYLESEETTDAWFILVDLSDKTNYPHYRTSTIILKSLRVGGNLTGALTWHVDVGVVTAVSTSATTIEWIWSTPLLRAMYFDERWDLPEHGLSLLVTGGTLENVATFEITTTAAITSSTLISTTVGMTGTVGVGDLIMRTDEISDTARLDIVVNTGYDTE